MIMADFDIDAIANEAEQEAKNQIKIEKEKANEPKKEFKPDLRIWIPAAVVVVAFIGFTVYTLFLM